MSSLVKTYDNAQVFISFGGRTLSGFAPDTKVTVEYDTEAWTKQVGCEGETTRSKSNNKCGKVTVRLMQTADDNDFLTALYEADQASNSSALPLQVKDSNGTSIHAAESAWISKMPTSEYGVAAGVREWMIDTGPMISVVGSN